MMETMTTKAHKILSRMDRIDHHYPTEPLPWRTNLSEYYDPIARVLHPGCGGPMMRFPPPHRGQVSPAPTRVSIDEPTDRDVVGGRGQGVQRLPGNKKYRALISMNKVRHSFTYSFK